MIDITHDPRASGEVLRYHTWRMNRYQTVGLHTWQVLRIMLTVWPDCPRNLLVHAVTHDMGEMAGDIPYPFKKRVPGLKETMDAAEDMVRSDMQLNFGMPPVVHLTELQSKFFKICENIEMWEEGLVEMHMGNHYATLIAERMLDSVIKLIKEIDDNQLVDAISNYISVRMKQEELATWTTI